MADMTLTPKDHANLTLFKVNAYGILVIGFGAATYFLIRAFDIFLQGSIFQQWAIYTIIGIGCVIYSMIIGFIAYWIKAYVDAFIIWFYGQFLFKEKDREQKSFFKRKKKGDKK